MSAPTIELRTVHSNGVELNVALSGTGPAVLLVPGWPHTWRVRTEVIGLEPITDDLVGRHLADCGHIIPLDQPDRLVAPIQPFLFP